jgi:hypothetical protein
MPEIGKERFIVVSDIWLFPVTFVGFHHDLVKITQSFYLCDPFIGTSAVLNYIFAAFDLASEKSATGNPKSRSHCAKLVEHLPTRFTSLYHTDYCFEVIFNGAQTAGDLGLFFRLHETNVSDPLAGCFVMPTPTGWTPLGVDLLAVGGCSPTKTRSSHRGCGLPD